MDKPLSHSLDIAQDEPKPKEAEDHKDSNETRKSSDKTFYIGLVIIILLFTAIFSFVRVNNSAPKTIEELHLANLKNKLNSKQGYIYNGIYSFVFLDGFWYMQLQSSTGKTVYDVAMRYGPKELENIRIKGTLNNTLFNNATEYYITFNPLGNDFSHVALAVGDFDQHMIKSFKKNAIAACDRNETAACIGRPIVTCNSTNDLVIYVKEIHESSVHYDNNCIVVEGKGFDLVKGTNRVVYNLYGIMKN